MECPRNKESHPGTAGGCPSGERGQGEDVCECGRGAHIGRRLSATPGVRRAEMPTVDGGRVAIPKILNNGAKSAAPIIKAGKGESQGNISPDMRWRL